MQCSLSLGSLGGVPSRVVFHRKERIKHHSFGATAPFKQTQSSQLARSTWTVAAAKKRNTVPAASDVSSDEGFDMMLGTGTPEYIATGLLGIFTGFVASGVPYLLGWRDFEEFIFHGYVIGLCTAIIFIFTKKIWQNFGELELYRDD